MDKNTVNMIVDLLEDKYMFDAAIEILQFSGGDTNLIEYFKMLKGENTSPDPIKLGEGRRERAESILSSRGKSSSQHEIILPMDDGRDFEKISRASILFNNREYDEAEKYFKEGIRGYNGSQKPIILTYICLCQYKRDEYAEALKTINEAVDLEPWNENVRLIRDGIIDRLSGMESKNRFIEEYYTSGTVVGEILKHSLELYHKIDSIEYKDRNFFRRIKGFVSEAKKLFIDEKEKLENDLINVEQFVLKGEKQLSLYLDDKEIKDKVKRIERFHLSEEIEKVFRIAETLYERSGREQDMDLSHIIFLYSKGVEMLCREKIIPYFNRNREKLPLLESRDDYNRIGIKSFDVGGLVRYSFNNSFKIDSSFYLQEINKNNLLRKDFKGREHLMPWDKLKFISHCIRTGKDPIDGTKSAGMLLLFYFAFKNYLVIDHTFLKNDDIIHLAGNLIRLQNERNSLIHSKILEDREGIEKFREISFDCVEKLSNINRLL